MEAFLSTLPPYVHKFLDKYPPTDVFNLLRELICFAVLYSEDRERIKAATEEFLAKRENEESEQEEDKEEDKEDKEDKEEQEEQEEIEQQVAVSIYFLFLLTLNRRCLSITTA